MSIVLSFHIMHHPAGCVASVAAVVQICPSESALRAPAVSERTTASRDGQSEVESRGKASWLYAEPAAIGQPSRTRGTKLTPEIRPFARTGCDEPATAAGDDGGSVDLIVQQFVVDLTQINNSVRLKFGFGGLQRKRNVGFDSIGAHLVLIVI